MIEFAHIYKVYPGSVYALKDVNLKIDKGEFVFLTGPSGAGKTTLFRLLAAYDRPSSGQASVLGFGLDTLSSEQIPAYRRHLGVVYQDFRLIRRKTVFENVMLPLEIRGEGEKYITERTNEVLDDVGLLHKRDDYPDHLSGGEQQRVAIARALVHKPGILIADEPTGNLDPDLSREIMKVFARINEQGTTLFVATHDHDLVRRNSRRTIQIEDGRIMGGA